RRDGLAIDLRRRPCPDDPPTGLWAVDEGQPTSIEATPCLVQALTQVVRPGCWFRLVQGDLQPEERGSRVTVLFQPVGVHQPKAVVFWVREQPTKKSQVFRHALGSENGRLAPTGA